jgi:hypothetical protein
VYLAAVLEYLAAEVSSFLSIVFRLSLYLDTTDFESALSPIKRLLRMILSLTNQHDQLGPACQLWQTRAEQNPPCTCCHRD